ncbi:MAG: ABC transporter ATP-binding protein [Actinomycetota bacterium]|nr:ABC transporter ATP-binding protein [Actinomycetota bacterium]
MSGAVAALDHATKRFGKTTALDDVSFEIQRGSVVALLGANGAGKTTALSLLLGLRRPDTGVASLFGRDPRLPETRARLGSTPQESGFPPTLRVQELLELVAAHYDEPADVPELRRRFLLDEVGGRQTGGLSGGQRRRLALALALVGSPELLVLDEPTTGLDVESREATWTALRAFVSDGGTILLTTHYLEEAQALASAIVVIDRGRVVTDGNVDDIRARVGVGRVRFASEPLATAYDGMTDDGAMVTIETPDPTATVRALVLAGARLDGLTVEQLPLEDMLRRISTEPT